MRSSVSGAMPLRAGRQREDEIAVDRRMRRPDGAGKAVMGRRSPAAWPPALVSTASVAITAMRGVFAGSRLVAEFQADSLRIGRDRRGQAEAAELVADLPGRRPEMAAVGRP